MTTPPDTKQTWEFYSSQENALSDTAPKDGTIHVTVGVGSDGVARIQSHAPLDNLPLQGSNSAKDLGVILNRCAAMGHSITNMYRIHSSAPQQLVTKSIAAATWQTFHRYLDENIYRSLLKAFPACDYPFSSYVLPTGRRSLHQGLFAPDADPNMPGTPHLVPVNIAGEPAWAIAYAGLSEFTRTQMATNEDVAPWHDAEAISALVAKVLDADLEYVETVAYLDAPEEYAQAKAHADRAKAFMSAREAFSRPKDRIRPRVCGEVFDQSVYETRAEAKVSGWELGMFYYGHDLRDSRARHSDPYGPQAKALHAAAQIKINTKQMDERIENAIAIFTSKLKSGVEEGKLGKLYRGSDGNLWIAKNIDLVAKHPTPFGLSAEYTFTEI